MITVEGQVLGIREAYDTCQGVLLCKGKLGQEFDVIDFKKEYGEDGSAYFVQRLLYSAHAPGSISKTQDGRNVALTRFYSQPYSKATLNRWLFAVGAPASQGC